MMSREQLMSVFESRLIELLNLAQQNKHNAALALLDKLERKYGQFDTDSWLKRTVLATRGHVLALKGDVVAARAAYRAAQDASPDASEFLVNQLALARLAPEPRHAIQELEVGLERAQGIARPTALSLLSFYAQIVCSIGGSVPVRYEVLLQSACEFLNLKPPEYIKGDAKAFTEAILAFGTKRPLSEEAGTF